MNRVALQMLMGDRSKYFGVILGVALASLLMVHQMTIFVGIMARTWSIVQDVHAGDVLVMDPETEFLDDVKPIPENVLSRVRGVEGVEWASPMYKGPIKARLSNGRFRTCIVVGLDRPSYAGGPTEMMAGRLEDLAQSDGVIVDRLDAGALLGTENKDGTKKPLRVGDTLELNDHRAVVVGICKNSRPFISQPVIYTTYTRALSVAPQERNGTAFILAKAIPGTDVTALCKKIKEQTGYAAHTKWEFGWMTVHYYLTHTGIPVNFGTTILLACVVGMAITGQTFYLFVLDNLKNLAAIKAMGATNFMLLQMTLVQAAVVGFIGYGLGAGGAALFFAAFKGTELDFNLYWQVLAIAAVVVVGIIGLASVFSLRKVFALEPAVVFR